MGMERRRTGFRLSWTANDKQGEGDAQHDEAASEAAPAAVDTMTADAPADETSAPETAATEASADAPAPDAAPDAANATPDAAPEAAADSPPTGATAIEMTPESESSEFLVSLVGAMRGVAETSRDASLADLRTTVDAHIERLNASSTEKESDLRRAADLDLQGVGDWERDEIERIKSEAETRRDARRTRLDQQLAEHRTASEREVEATRARLSDHERELAAFFAQLGEINDPAAFVAAAKRMPRPPELNSTSAPTDAPATETETPTPSGDPRLAAMGMSAGTDTDADASEAAATADSNPEAEWPTPADADATAEAGDASTDNRLAARLAQLDQRIAGGTQAVAATAPAPTNGNETSTAVIVKGLGSFGAITSFKQSLERVEGVRGVTLSLGPTGEFVYRASHAADFDMVAAVQSVEGPSATVENTDGTLIVTLGRSR
ncbi:MAG TPA: hypothetical protein VIH19_02595 [Candidatus Limnocylindria bacterium]|jgi:hypothetical protein